MSNDPLEPCDIFVSYARVDNTAGRVTAFVEQIQHGFQKLTGRPLRVFIDHQELHAFDDWQHRILEQLRASHLLVVCVSPAYLASDYCRWEFSEYVKGEVARGLVGDGVAALYVSDVPGWDDAGFDDGKAPWITELRRRHHVDLRHWSSSAPSVASAAEEAPQWASLLDRIRDRLERGRSGGTLLGNVDAHNGRFVGREIEIRRLREDLIAPASVGKVSFVYGLGGMGKTAVAVEYAHAYGHHYGGGRWQIPCAGVDDLRIAMAKLAPALRVEFVGNERLDRDLQLQRILAELRHLADSGLPHRCLVVLDGVDRPALLDLAHLQRVPMADGLDVVVTTTLGPAEWPDHDPISFLPIDRLGDDEACALIQRYRSIRPSADDREAGWLRQIVQLLGGYTLAIEAAGVALSRRGTRPEHLLVRLRREGLEGLEDEALRSAQSIRHREVRLSATLQATLEQLSSSEELAAQYAGLLPPDAIGWEWIESLLGDSFPPEIDLAASVGELDPWTLVRTRLEGLRLLTPADDRTAQMHVLVQDVIRSRDDSDRSRLERNLIEHGLRRCRFLEKNWTDPDVHWELAPLTAWGRHLIAVDPEKGGALESSLGNLLRRLARFADAEPLLRHALKMAEGLEGPEDQGVSTALHDLAGLLRETARLDEAEVLLRRAVDVDERSRSVLALGRDLNSLGLLLLETGRWKESEPLLRRAVFIVERHEAQDHPNVARVLTNLALLLRKTDRVSEAEPLYRRALAIEETNFGPDHPYVALSLINLAGLLKATNRVMEAEPLYWRALAILEASFGPDHPKFATSLDNLGSLLQATNRRPEAELLHRRALAIYEASFGPDHPDVATCLDNLAGSLMETDRVAEAEPLYRRSLAIREAILGPDHPDVAACLDNLAGSLMETDRMAEAEPLQRRALAIYEACFGPNHSDVAICLDNIGALLEAMNRGAEAKPLHRRAQAIRKARYGPAIPPWRRA